MQKPRPPSPLGLPVGTGLKTATQTHNLFSEQPRSYMSHFTTLPLIVRFGVRQIILIGVNVTEASDGDLLHALP